MSWWSNHTPYPNISYFILHFPKRTHTHHYHWWHCYVCTTGRHNVTLLSQRDGGCGIWLYCFSKNFKKNLQTKEQKIKKKKKRRSAHSPATKSHSWNIPLNRFWLKPKFVEDLMAFISNTERDNYFEYLFEWIPQQRWKTKIVFAVLHFLLWIIFFFYNSFSSFQPTMETAFYI